MKKSILIFCLILVVYCQLSHAQSNVINRFCRSDDDCLCGADAPHVTDACGKPGQVWRCWSGQCRLAFESESEEMWRKRSWFSCSQDNDCVVIENGCGWSCVNQKYKVEAERYFVKQSTMIECMEHSEAFHGQAKCIESQCVCNKSLRNDNEQ